MKVNELKKGTVYKNIIDVNIPLLFTGKTTTLVQYGTEVIIAYFKPVKTNKNKNWYNTIKVITKAFNKEYGNQYITNL